MRDSETGDGRWHVGGLLLAWRRREGGRMGRLLLDGTQWLCLKKLVVCVGGWLWVMRGGLSLWCSWNIQPLLFLFWIGTFGCPHLIDLCRSVHCPIGTLARVILRPRDFPEAFIKGQIMPNGVLPSTACSAVIRKSVTDPGVDVIQTQLPLRCSCYCHGNESGVAVRGFPFTVSRGGVRHKGYEVSPLPPSVFLLVPLPSSSLFTRAQAADSQLGQPVYAGETGVQVRRHCLFFYLSRISLQLLEAQGLTNC